MHLGFVDEDLNFVTLTLEQRLVIMDKLLNNVWAGFSAVSDPMGQDRTDDLARGHPFDAAQPLPGIAPAMIGTADVNNPQHTVAMNADLAQKEIMDAACKYQCLRGQ